MHGPTIAKVTLHPSPLLGIHQFSLKLFLDYIILLLRGKTHYECLRKVPCPTGVDPGPFYP